MEEVCLELHRRGIEVLTVFDSIIVKDKDAEEAREIFGDAFGGLAPEIEAEDRSGKATAEPHANASDTGGDFAPDRPASAESGANPKPKASPTLG
jgi:hypothetical protein